MKSFQKTEGGGSSFYEGELNAFDYFEKNGFAIYISGVCEAHDEDKIQDWLTLYNEVEEVIL